MFCDSYRRKLEDAAVGGERPGVELRRHLTACAKCAADWQDQRALFAAIDSQLREAANGEVPASLVARTRQRVTANEPYPIWWKPALAFAVALLMVAGFAVRLALRNSPNGNAAEHKKPEATAPAYGKAQFAKARAERGDSASVDNPVGLPQRTPADSGVRQAGAAKIEVRENRERVSFEVLPPPGEAAGLEQYIERLRSRTTQMAIRAEAKDSGVLGIQKVQIAEIELTEMAILPLDSAK